MSNLRNKCVKHSGIHIGQALPIHKSAWLAYLRPKYRPTRLNYEKFKKEYVL